MNKLLVFASAFCVASAMFADEQEHPDIMANASGYYDVTLTTKSLEHSEKTVTKTFSTKYKVVDKKKEVVSSAFDQFAAEVAKVSGLAGYWFISAVDEKKNDVDPKGDPEECTATKITFKYSYFDFKEAKVYEGTGRNRKVARIDTNYVTKVVSTSYKGVYDPKGDTNGVCKAGMVYLWDTAAASKVKVTYGEDDNAIVLSKQSRGVERAQTGFVAYQVPFAMDKQFIKTDDGKAAGGFTGDFAESEDGTELDFRGLTAFGTGTYDAKNDGLKSVAGNVARKNPGDAKNGSYGTWKLQLDATSTKKYSGDIKSVLRNKGCVQLFMEFVQ